MSLILDALKKSEAERNRADSAKPVQAQPGAETSDPTSGNMPKAARTGGVSPLAIVGVIAVFALLVGGFWLWSSWQPAPTTEQASAPKTPPEPTPAPSKTEPAAVASAPDTEPKPEPNAKPEQTATPPQAEQEPTPLPAPEPEPTPESAAEPAVPSPAPNIDLPELSDPVAYLERAWESISRGLYNRAIADFSAALRIEPGFVEAYLGRGWAHERKGDFGAAEDDYGEVVERRPNDANGHFSRGVVRLYQQELEAAVDDFGEVIRLNAPDLRAYALLWRWVAEAQLGGDQARSTLLRALRAEDLNAWPGPVLALYAGRASVEETLVASTDSDPVEARGKVVVAQYFIGEYLASLGDKIGAGKAFQAALDTKASGFRQFDAARVALTRLTSQ